MGGESVDREDVDNEELYLDCYDRDRKRIENDVDSPPTTEAYKTYIPRPSTTPLTLVQ
jgi:hypothetical protein